MLLHDVLAELAKINVGIVEERKFKSQTILVLGFKPRNPAGPQYPVDVTSSTNPDLSEVEVEIIRRRFTNS